MFEINGTQLLVLVSGFAVIGWYWLMGKFWTHIAEREDAWEFAQFSFIIFIAITVFNVMISPEDMTILLFALAEGLGAVLVFLRLVEGRWVPSHYIDKIFYGKKAAPEKRGVFPHREK